MSKCLACDYLIDSATSVITSDELPEEGDISICLRCGALAIFNSDLSIRQPTEEERNSLQDDPEVVQAQSAIKELAALQNVGEQKDD